MPTETTSYVPAARSKLTNVESPSEPDAEELCPPAPESPLPPPPPLFSGSAKGEAKLWDHGFDRVAVGVLERQVFNVLFTFNIDDVGQ